MPGDTTENRAVSPIRLELLITVVEKSKAAFYMDLIQSFEVNLQLALPARGTADRELLRYLGLADTEKTAILSVVRADRLDALTETLAEKFRSIRDGDGVAAAIPLTSMIGTLLFGFLSNDKRMIREEDGRG